MTDDVEQIMAEIDRLTLQTTDPAPLQLFVERSRLQKRVQIWKFAGGTICILVAVIAFFAVFSNSDYGFIEAGAAGIFVFFIIALVGRADINAKTENWLARARAIVGR